MRSLQRLKQHHATYCGLVEAPSGRCRLIRPPRGVRMAGDHITLRTEGDPTNLWKGSSQNWLSQPADRDDMPKLSAKRFPRTGLKQHASDSENGYLGYLGYLGSAGSAPSIPHHLSMLLPPVNCGHKGAPDGW